MPWHALGAAPLALAVVHGILSRTHPGITVTEHYLNLRWAEYLLEVTGGQLTPRHYQDVADNGIPAGVGHWIFAGVLYEDPGWRHAEFASFASQCGIDVTAAMRMRALAEDFIDMTAREIAAMSPDLIGFTTTFMQNVPSLALANRLRQLGVGAPTIFGGANCDGPMGAALHRHHRFVDFVVRGEAELALPQLVCAILADQPADGIDGVCWWRDGDAVANPQLQPAVPATSLPAVDYDSWHGHSRRLRSPSTRPHIWWSRARGAAGGVRYTSAHSADSTIRRLPSARSPRNCCGRRSPVSSSVIRFSTSSPATIL